MMQSVEDGQVNLAKYGQLLEDAALKHQLAHTKAKNVPLVTEPPTEEVRSVDLSELQAKLRKLEKDRLEMPEDATPQTSGNPGTWVEEQPTPQVTPTPATASTESQWKPLPTPKTRKHPRHRKRKSKMEMIPESAALSDAQWTFTIDLSTDKQKTVFGVSMLFLLGMAVLIVYLLGVCLCRICSCCKKTCRGYKLAAMDSDCVTPAEWELQELKYA